MLFRFSLYGFLKNQTYFEPFLVLAFLEKGLTFGMIGLLIGFREVAVNVFEIPSGALADLYGRRRCMVISFASYILSFLIFTFGENYWHLMAGMLFFGGGEAFRSGTHKAMILDWLRAQGRENERTRVYGFTRSWSKIGSAVSVLIATGLVFYSGNYSYIFLYAAIPYVINLINLATYPANLDGATRTDVSFRELVTHLRTVGRAMLDKPILRRLVWESMSCEGVYAAIKDYLQPLLKLTALTVPILVTFPDKQRTALLIGAVYFLLHLLSSWGARKSHVVQDALGGEERAARTIWFGIAFLYAALTLLLLSEISWGVISVYVLLAIITNVWRPILISRFDSTSRPEWGATVLSIEAQANSVTTMLLAPALGFILDYLNPNLHQSHEANFWPVAVVGFFFAGLMCLFKPPMDKAVLAHA